MEIRLAAEGVAFCSTGREMTGREGTRGRVEDLGMEGFLSSDGEEPERGRVLVLDSRGMVVAEVKVVFVGNKMVGELAVTEVGSSVLTATASVGLTSVLGLTSGTSFFVFKVVGLGGGLGGTAFLTATAAASDMTSCLFLVSDFEAVDLKDVILLTDSAAASAESAAFLRLLALWLLAGAAVEAVKAELARPANDEL